MQGGYGVRARGDRLREGGERGTRCSRGLVGCRGCRTVGAVSTGRCRGVLPKGGVALLASVPQDVWAQGWA